MSTSSNAIFSGGSRYSNDFAQVIDRAVRIASLPINQLNNQQTQLSSESSALTSLSGTFTSLQSSISSLSSSLGGSTYSVSYSDGTVATALAGASALPGTYTLQVVDPGSRASVLSNATVTDPTTTSISSSGTFTLNVNGQSYDNIQPATNSLLSLASAINTATAGAVQATVVNVGSPATPSYQLSIQNQKYGPVSALTLDDGSGNILGAPTTATAVQYRVNGQPAVTPISGDTRTITLAPDVTVSVLKAGSTDITISQSTAGLASGITGFVNAYNSALKALDGQHGQNNGSLAGQSIINTLSQSLRSLTGYAGTGSIQSIAEIGLTFDKDGVLSFDSSVLSAAASKDFKGVTDFLGSATDGGFLKAATGVLNSITDSVTGILPTAISSVAGEIKNTNTQISQNQDRVDQLKERLSAQMAAADALIASMEQQVTYMTNLFTAMTANQNAMK
jgi:flagellar hook-associated protein 2